MHTVTSLPSGGFASCNFFPVWEVDSWKAEYATPSRSGTDMLVT